MAATQHKTWDVVETADIVADEPEADETGEAEREPVATMPAEDLVRASASTMAVANAPRHAALLTREEEIELARRIELGDEEARRQLIEANHRLVFRVVNKHRYSGVPIEDLVQEGFLGLIAAADKFDRHRGCRFSTVATIWIRAHVLQAIQELRPMIHVPQRVANAAKRVWRATEEMTQELERRPTSEELANKLSLEPERVDELIRITPDLLSLDEPMGEDGDGAMVEMMADDVQTSPPLAAQRSCLKGQLSAALDRLSEREQLILRMRFGLDDGQEHTLDQIGRRFSLTRQRIKEIETTALAKLRQEATPGQTLDAGWAAN